MGRPRPVCAPGDDFRFKQVVVRRTSEVMRGATAESALADLMDHRVVTHDLGSTLGVYELLEVLGEGGMGRVFLAEHQLLGRRVALKVLRSEHARDPLLVKRFFAEARTVNQISHQNIVEITDFVDGEDGTSFLVMEYLQGSPLSAVVCAGPVGLLRSVRIGRQIASALAAVHAVGIVHRDLKPDNVFLIDRPHPDFVKVLDFGAAKLNPKVVPGSVQTQALTIIGTPQYMSPEQATGAPVDGRSDIYALGVVLYEMVTGGNPFHASDAWSVIRRQVTHEPDHLNTMISLVPPCPELGDVIMRCLAKDPDERPDAISEVESVLAEIEQRLTPQHGAHPSIPPVVIPSHRDVDPSTMMLRRAGVGSGHRGRGLLVGLVAAIALVAAVGLWLRPTDELLASPLAEEQALAAPVEPPKPTPVTELRRQVLLRSDPAGAEVRQHDSSTVLGRTPLTLSVAANRGTVRYVFSKSGFRDQAVDVDESMAAPVATLSPLPPPPPVRRAPRVRRTPSAPKPKPKPKAADTKPKKKPTGRNGLIEPVFD